MPENQSLESAEQLVREETRAREATTIQAVERMINLYLDGFGAIGRFYKSDDNRIEQVWFLLSLRTFQSLRMAYYLLETGYYSQSIT